jgi:type II secretory pathway component PulJ
MPFTTFHSEEQECQGCITLKESLRHSREIVEVWSELIDRQEEEIAKLKTRVASLEANLRAFEMANGQCHRQRDALKARVGELEAALRAVLAVSERQRNASWNTVSDCARAVLAAKGGDQVTNPADDLWVEILKREPMVARMGEKKARTYLRAAAFPAAIIDGYMGWRGGFAAGVEAAAKEAHAVHDRLRLRENTDALTAMIALAWIAEVHDAIRALSPAAEPKEEP